MASKLALSTLISLALAQTTVITIPLVGFDRDGLPLVASVISANPTATTLSLACPTGKDGSENLDCGLFPAQILTIGPSVYIMDMSDPTPDSDFTMTQDCSINLKASSAVCKESASGSAANFPGSSTETYGPGSSYMEVITQPLTITKGVEKLTAGGSAPATSATGSANAAASNGASPSTTLATATGTPSGTAASASGSAAPQSTGAAVANAVVLGGGFIGAAAAMLGGLVL